MVLKRELVFIAIGIFFLAGSVYGLLSGPVFDFEFLTLFALGLYLVLSPQLARYPLVGWGFEVSIMALSFVNLYFDVVEAVFGLISLAQVPVGLFFAIRAFFPRTFLRRMARRQRNTLQTLVSVEDEPRWGVEPEKVKEKARELGQSDMETDLAMKRIGIDRGRVRPSWEYLPVWYDRLIERLHLQAIGNRIQSILGFISIALGVALPPRAGGVLAVSLGLYLVLTSFRLIVPPVLRLLDIGVGMGLLFLTIDALAGELLFDILTLGLFAIVFLIRGITPTVFLRLTFVDRPKYRVLRTIYELEQESGRVGRGIKRESVVESLIAQGWDEDDARFYLSSVERLNMARDVDGGVSITAFYVPAYYYPLLESPYR